MITRHSDQSHEMQSSVPAGLQARQVHAEWNGRQDGHSQFGTESKMGISGMAQEEGVTSEAQPQSQSKWNVLGSHKWVIAKSVHVGVGRCWSVHLLHTWQYIGLPWKQSWIQSQSQIQSQNENQSQSQTQH